MAGVPWNKLPIEEHIVRGTFRKDRHARAEPAPDAPVSAADRRRTLSGLGPEARRMASGLLDAYAPWDVASLSTLRLWAQSAERLAVVSDDAERQRETRTYLALLAALGLGR